MIDKYPYTDLHQLNLDWIINAIIDATKAVSISFDPSGTELTATNVQAALNEVMNDFVTRAVLSFNGRGGEVTPQAGDYNANQISYLTGTVADALAEALAKAGVKSFNGRDGIVLPESGDYDATEISFYDELQRIAARTVQDAILEINGKIVPATAGTTSYNNTVSHLQASNVQQAIDALVNSILSSGVASFNGRTGAVIPENNDYSAALISYDNRASHLLASSVQNAIDELAGGSPSDVTITLTVTGAKDDAITIYDDEDNLLGVCVFNNATSGTVTITFPDSKTGNLFRFVSAVAKDFDGNDYEKQIQLTDESTLAVVMPDNAYYWYGNDNVGALVKDYYATLSIAGILTSSPINTSALTKAHFHIHGNAGSSGFSINLNGGDSGAVELKKFVAGEAVANLTCDFSVNFNSVLHVNGRPYDEDKTRAEKNSNNMLFYFKRGTYAAAELYFDAIYFE